MITTAIGAELYLQKAECRTNIEDFEYDEVLTELQILKECAKILLVELKAQEKYTNKIDAINNILLLQVGQIL